MSSIARTPKSTLTGKHHDTSTAPAEQKDSGWIATHLEPGAEILILRHQVAAAARNRVQASLRYAVVHGMFAASLRRVTVQNYPPVATPATDATAHGIAHD
jgi:hypothetical protein